MNLHGDQSGDHDQTGDQTGADQIVRDQAGQDQGSDISAAEAVPDEPQEGAPAAGQTLSAIFILGAADREADLLRLFDAEKCRFYDPAEDAFSSQLKPLLRHPSPKRLVVLTPRTPSSVRRKVAEAGLNRVFVEEGFLRGPGLPGRASPSFSYVLDDLGPYYDPTAPSRLETVLATHDFAADPALMDRARALRDAMIRTGTGRFTHALRRHDPAALLGEKTRKRVVVLGHQPGARATEAANVLQISHAELVCLAQREHPGAEILFKPHPMDLHLGGTSSAEVRAALPGVVIPAGDLPLSQVLDTADHVITVASLGGFEAALRGLPVTVLGAPFYAGWGLTDDRAAPERRQRRLTAEEILAGAYLLQSTYRDPLTHAPLEACDVVEALAAAQLAEADPLSPDLTAPLVLAHLGGGPAEGLLRQMIPMAGLQPFDQKDPDLRDKLLAHQQAQRALAPDRVAPVLLGHPVRLSLRRMLEEAGIPVIHLDEGFLFGGAEPPAPGQGHSWLVARRAPHYDAARPSDLELLLQKHDFAADSALMARALALKARMLEAGLSDRNDRRPAPLPAALLQDLGSAPRVLVLGQAAGDPALALANPRGCTLEQMLRIARREHPEAEILVWLPPKETEARAEVTALARRLPGLHLLEADLPPTGLFAHVGHVFTISALAGFEAALRGLPVTVLGAPFYAGWGVTDDRAAPARRQRRLTVDQIFAAAYLLHPVHVDPLYGSLIAAEAAVDLICRDLAAAQSRARPATPGVALIMRPHESAALRHAFPGQSVTAHDYKDGNFLKGLQTALRQNPDLVPVLHQRSFSSARRAVVTAGRPWLEAADGFLCAVGHPEKGAEPHSVLLDAQAPHYDAARVSQLETLLASHDFTADPALLPRARAAIARILAEGLTRYTPATPPADLAALYGVKTRKRVLVLGHREADAAVALANPLGFGNADLLRIAAREHPGAQILFKPHPSDMKPKLEPGSLPADVTVLAQPLALPQALETVDHVITLASLGGFEAALRGLPVTVLGAPFYAGWGLTDDRAAPERRQRRLTAEEIFAAAYILYPAYVDPLYRRRVEIEDVIEALVQDRARQMAPAEAPKLAVIRPEAPVTSPVPADPGELPRWFRQRPGPVLADRLASGKPVYLYMPWIAEHGDVLMGRLASPEDYLIAPFDLVDGVEDNDIRRQVMAFARERPDLYRKILLRRLIPLRKHVKGFILTFDWAPVMRMIVEICRDLEIPTILIPHESVFVDKEKYYWDLWAQASVPYADVILGWGDLQKSIFAERGFPVETRFLSVGAPKFDTYYSFEPQLTRDQFCRIFGLDPSRKIALFATQPLDSQLDTKVARKSQRDAISDLMTEAQRLDCQVLVRLPPSKDDILGKTLRDALAQMQGAAVDDATCYLVSPEEAIFHADVVLSVNSTMLFEGVLMGRAAISMKYVDFDQIWEPVGIPAPRNHAQFVPAFEAALSGTWRPSEDGMKWAAQQFGAGVFDGKAVQRIREKLASWASLQPLEIAPRALARIMAGHPLDVVAVPSSDAVMTGVQKYLAPMVNARKLISSRTPDLKLLASVEVFLQWGITPNAAKAAQADAARALGRPVVYVEDGFIRSVAIGLSGTPTLSIIMDDRTAYYDATRVSRLESLLQDGPDLTPDQHARARQAIDRIVARRISKYNHAPDARLAIGEPGRPKLLLVDQRFGDQSVASGLASEESYDAMLFDAIRERPDHDIIVKQHPDAISGGKAAYFTPERLARIANLTPRLYPVAYEVNPYALFDLAEEVWVGTSGMGFEALMAGCRVRCYGVPYYSGWGVTDDRQTLPRRSRRRSVEDLFHFAWIALSRYVDPEAGRACEIEDVIDHICRERGW